MKMFFISVPKRKSFKLLRTLQTPEEQSGESVKNYLTTLLWGFLLSVGILLFNLVSGTSANKCRF